MAKQTKKYCAVFTGGGTGGHIYPGLAVVDELKKKHECTVY
ncbi:MAG: glycosyltransferase, partial [Spirochaetaceae bacterium]|nr:glycosyltransferase [Spirochaetaceae bacterium]